MRRGGGRIVIIDSSTQENTIWSEMEMDLSHFSPFILTCQSVSQSQSRTCSGMQVAVRRGRWEEEEERKEGA